MKRVVPLLSIVAVLAGSGYSQTPSPQPSDAFARAGASVRQQLAESIEALDRLRQQVAEEKIPLSRRLSELENQLAQLRQSYQQTTRALDNRTLDLTNLRTQVKSRKEETAYLFNLLTEYVRNFEARLHIAELQHYRDVLEAAKAAEQETQSDDAALAAQLRVVARSVERLCDALGGSRFEGNAVDGNGLVRMGSFVLIGPAAVFRSSDGQTVGAVTQRLGSLEPVVVPFRTEEDTRAAEQLVVNAAGTFPLDPTLGNAQKIERTQETLLEHIRKGGPVMYPIFALAGAALLVALYKWVRLAFVRIPSQRRIRDLLAAVARESRYAALDQARAIGGPIGRMLTAGIEHLGEPRELVEEVMYEKVLATRFQLERFLSFIAICAASAPLLGLLGTVTGIINTFRLITVFGSGDVKTLSGGISEALITTEYGLIVAIPSLLIHAFLSRKVRSIVHQMEQAAMALLNQTSRTALVPHHPLEVRP